MYINLLIFIIYLLNRKIQRSVGLGQRWPTRNSWEEDKREKEFIFFYKVCTYLPIETILLY